MPTDENDADRGETAAGARRHLVSDDEMIRLQATQLERVTRETQFWIKQAEGLHTTVTHLRILRVYETGERKGLWAALVCYIVLSFAWLTPQPVRVFLVTAGGGCLLTAQVFALVSMWRRRQFLHRPNTPSLGSLTRGDYR